MKNLYKIEYTNRAYRDIDIAQRQGVKLEGLRIVLDLLASGAKLDAKYKDHRLHGKYSEFRGCHISPDFVLIYRRDHERLVITAVRVGSHSNLRL